MQINLADREAELMDVLWDQGPSTVTDVQARLNDELAYTTVLSHLRALEAKGYVGHTEEGRAHRYHALIERADAQKGALDALLSKLFKGSSDALLLHMVSDDRLSAKQVQRIEERLRNKVKRKST
jgi:BlaI family transcriptional regulator, penicillinase repressor